MNNEFSGKVGVITGGGTGVGKATAKFLAEKGCSLILLGRRVEKLQETEEEITALNIPGVRVEAVVCDVTKDDEVRVAFAKIAEMFGQIDFLVNNAGVNTYTTLEKITATEIENDLQVKTHGIIFCTREAIKLMKEGSAIVNLTSVNAFLGGKTSPAYPAANGAANTLTKYFANKLIDKGIRVNAVAPGLIEGSEMTKKSLDEQKLSQIASQNPMKRNCTPDDVAKAIYFLLSDLSSYVSGHTLHVNGGYYMN